MSEIVLPEELEDIKPHNFRRLVDQLSGGRFRAEVWPIVPRDQEKSYVFEGGESFVFFCHDEWLEREVVLKLAKSPAREDPRSRARFFRGARIQSIMHRTIPEATPEVLEAQQHYYVVDYIPGKCFFDYLDGQENPYPLMYRIICLAQKIHEYGVIYRDFKPGNFLITEEGEPKIIDFGVAKCIQDSGAKLTRPGDKIGTPLFWNEDLEFRPETVTIDADIALLGKLLWCSCMGRKAEDRSEWSRYVTFHRPPWKKYYWPSQRKEYRSALEFAEDIRNGEGIKIPEKQTGSQEIQGSLVLTAGGVARELEKIYGEILE